MNYKRLQKTFERLISRYDQRNPRMQLKLRRSGTIDPLTGLFVEGTNTEQSIRGVTVNYEFKQVDGEMIQIGDLKLIHDSNCSPQVGDYVIVDGDEYTVVEPIVVHNPGGVILGGECNLRR